MAIAGPPADLAGDTLGRAHLRRDSAGPPANPFGIAEVARSPRAIPRATKPRAVAGSSTPPKVIGMSASRPSRSRRTFAGSGIPSSACRAASAGAGLEQPERSAAQQHGVSTQEVHGFSPPPRHVQGAAEHHRAVARQAADILGGHVHPWPVGAQLIRDQRRDPGRSACPRRMYDEYVSACGRGLHVNSSRKNFSVVAWG
jgi:hypothetical protein